MEIILLQDVEHVGEANTIVTVKDGYARNYLIPKGLAMLASKGNRASLSDRIRQAEAREAKILAEVNLIAEKIKASVVVIKAKAGTSGKIFGSVNAVQISQALKEQLGVDVERKYITIAEEVKELGTHTAIARLHKKVSVQFNFDVVED